MSKVVRCKGDVLWKVKGNPWSTAWENDGDDGKAVGLDLAACVLLGLRECNFCITRFIMLNCSFIVL